MNCTVLNYTGNLWLVKFDGAKEMSECGIWEIIIIIFTTKKKFTDQFKLKKSLLHINFPAYISCTYRRREHDAR